MRRKNQDDPVALATLAIEDVGPVAARRNSQSQSTDASMVAKGEGEMNNMNDLVPISHLELDLPAPILGWGALFEERGIELLEDDIGRRAISREDARTLLAEHREREARLLEDQRCSERADRIPAGVPALEGATPFESMVAGSDYVSVAQEFGRPPPSFLEEELTAGQRESAERGRAVARMKDDLGGKQ